MHMERLDYEIVAEALLAWAFKHIPHSPHGSEKGGAIALMRPLNRLRFLVQFL